MTLQPTQVEQFYRMWLPLLKYANDQLNVVPDLSGKGPKGTVDRGNAVKVRNVLWENEKLIEEFIAKNPAQLPPEDLKILESWKYHRKGTFMVYKVFKKHAIFINQDKKSEVFAVKGLASSFDEIFGPNVPVMVETVLLPFNDEIIADGLFQSYNISFGPGIRANLKDIYDDVKERGAIITSLLPAQNTPSRGNLIAQAEATNAKVLDAFQRYQYKSGLSPKTVERDTTFVTTTAQTLLSQQPDPISLRDLDRAALMNYLSSIPEKERKAARLSLRRFISFLQDTGRVDWGEAEDMLDVVKQQ